MANEFLSKHEAAEKLRDVSRKLTEASGDSDLTSLAADLDSIAESTAFIGECTIQVPFADIYLNSEGPKLRYVCTHEPPHEWPV